MGYPLYIKSNELYLGIDSHQNKFSMTNVQVSKYLLGMIVSSIGVLVHLFQMIETSEGIHIVCFFLWFFILGGLYYILGKELKRF